MRQVLQIKSYQRQIHCFTPSKAGQQYCDLVCTQKECHGMVVMWRKTTLLMNASPTRPENKQDSKEKKALCLRLYGLPKIHKLYII